MIVQFVRFETDLSEEEVSAVALKRIDEFRAIPGLLQKYYVKLASGNEFGGVYIWDSEESLNKYRNSDLAASIPAVYKVKGNPKIEVYEGLFKLRE